GFSVFGVPEIPEMASIRIQRHLIAQSLFQRFDRSSVVDEIIRVMYDMHLRIAADLIENRRQGSSLEEALQISSRGCRLAPPHWQSNVLAVTREAQILWLTKPSSRVALGFRLLRLNDLCDIDELWQRGVQMVASR